MRCAERVGPRRAGEVRRDGRESAQADGGAVTADGRYLWTVSTGVGNNDVRIVDSVRHRVCQVLPVPGASGGIALDSVHRLAYVSGLPVSLWLPSEFKLPGAQGDNVLVFSWSSSCGHARLVRVIAVPPQAGALAPQVFPPNPNGKRLSWPERLAVSADGSRLLVPLNLADSAAVIDLNQGDRVHYVTLGSGSYPFGAAILPDGRTGLVTNEARGTMSVLDMASGTLLANIRVGGALSHPEGVAVNGAGTRAYVALANSDQVAVVDLRTRHVARMISVYNRFGLGTTPVALALDPSGARLFVAESGADAVAAIRLPGKGTPARLDWTVVGHIPTAEQPEAVLTSPARGGQTAQLIWIAARGADTGPLPNGPNPMLASDPIFWAFHPVPPPTVDIFNVGVGYGAVVLRGEAVLLAPPTNARVADLTATAEDTTHPAGGRSPPKATNGPGWPRAGGPATPWGGPHTRAAVASTGMAVSISARQTRPFSNRRCQSRMPISFRVSIAEQ